MELNKIYNEDCLTGLKKLKSNSIDCCITSPPYYKLRDYGNVNQIGLEETPIEFIEKLVQVFEEVRRVLKKDGTLFLNLGDSYFGTSSVRHAVSCGTSGKEPEDCPENDCLCGNLCDACRVAYQIGRSHSDSLPVPKQAVSPSLPTHGHKESKNDHSPTSDFSHQEGHISNAIQDSENFQTHEAEQPLSFQESRLSESSSQQEGHSPPLDNFSSCLLCGNSFVNSFHPFVGKMVCTCGIAKPLGALKKNKSDKAFSGLAYNKDTLNPKDLMGIPWAVAEALRAPKYLGIIKNEVDRSWMAAIMDGEGTINAFDVLRKDDGRIRTGINICVTNSNLKILDRCFEIYPTSRSEHNEHGEGHLGSLPTYRWIVHGTENKILFLKELYPYLIGKQKQALLAYNLLLFQVEAKRLGKTPMKDTINSKRQHLASLISRLNNAEDVDIPDWCIPVDTNSMYGPGWYLRQDIIWHKRNPMPESVTDRCTKSHEYVFLLSKSQHYYFDAQAILEEANYDGRKDTIMKGSEKYQNGFAPTTDNPQSLAMVGHERWRNKINGDIPARNKRSVWSVNVQGYAEAHFATFPEDLIVDMIKAGSSEHGCCKLCGTAYTRILEPSDRYAKVLGESYHDHSEDLLKGMMQSRGSNKQNKMRDAGIHNAEYETKGWEKNCKCKTEEIVPSIIIDPFMGAGTTALVARKLNRNFIGFELNPEYIDISNKRLYSQLGMFL